MSNNKQIEKPLELPHQETIVGTNTIQTKPFDNQKTMSNNEFSSVEWLYNKMVLKLCNKLQTIEYTHIFLEEFEQAKAMHRKEIMYAYMKTLPIEDGVFTAVRKAEQYYNETYGYESIHQRRSKKSN